MLTAVSEVVKSAPKFTSRTLSKSARGRITVAAATFERAALLGLGRTYVWVLAALADLEKRLMLTGLRTPGQPVHPGLEGLAKSAGVSLRQLRRLMPVLRATGLLFRHHAPGAGSSGPTHPRRGRPLTIGMADEYTITRAGWDLLRGRPLLEQSALRIELNTKRHGGHRKGSGRSPAHIGKHGSKRVDLNTPDILTSRPLNPVQGFEVQEKEVKPPPATPAEAAGIDLALEGQTGGQRAVLGPRTPPEPHHGPVNARSRVATAPKPTAPISSPTASAWVGPDFSLEGRRAGISRAVYAIKHGRMPDD